MAAACSSTTSSSSVVFLREEQQLDIIADSATSPCAVVDSRSTRWPEAGRTKSTFEVVQPLHSTMYHIPNNYTLVNAKDLVACEVPVPPEGSSSGSNAICVYAAAFEAGMRLPFHDLHAAVLRHYGLAPSQLLPNAWRYLSAFVLLCQEAGVEPTLSVFRYFFSLCAHKKSDSAGRYHLKPSPRLSSGSASHHRRLFTGKVPQQCKLWKSRFFFVYPPPTVPWPCSPKWGTPSKASIKEPVETTDATAAIPRLVDRAGDNGIDIMRFLSERNPPVGHQIPVQLAVKEETEQTRKRKSTELPITALPPSSSSTCSLPATVGVGFEHGEPNVTGVERSHSWMLLHSAQLVTTELQRKEQELQRVREELQRIREELQTANTQHVAEVAQLKDELQKAKAEASRSAGELQKAKADHVAMVLQITAWSSRSLQTLTCLLSDSTPPQPLGDDQN